MRFCLCLLAWLLASSLAHAVTITEIVLDGLPAEIQADAVVAKLALKKGEVYDKLKEPADRAEIATLLQDAGYLDAEVRANNIYVTGGTKLTFFVKVHNLFTIESVKVTGLAPEVVQGVLDELKITKDTPYNRAICDQLGQAIAPKLNINVLYLDLSRKLNANKKDVTLIFSK